ncbi:hypothetical protein BH11ACT8_BH11ACT8_16950 [soil metagenome]
MLRTEVHLLPARSKADLARRSASRRSPSAQEWERANRIGLLLIHAFVGLFAGLLILFSGTASVFDDHDSWARPLTGGLALLGGALLLSGLARSTRHVHLEIAGLVVLAAWDLTMTAGFVIATVQAGDVDLTWPWAALAHTPTTRLYPIVLYVGLFLMMSVHLVTLRRVRRIATRPRLRVGTRIPMA